MLYHTYDQEVGFPHSSVGKESARSAGDPGSIPRSGRSPGEGNGNPLQYSCHHKGKTLLCAYWLYLTL